MGLHLTIRTVFVLLVHEILHELGLWNRLKHHEKCEPRRSNGFHGHLPLQRQILVVPPHKLNNAKHDLILRWRSVLFSVLPTDPAVLVIPIERVAERLKILALNEVLHLIESFVEKTAFF